MKRRVLITGGNKGIGLKVTEMFLNNGYEVIVVARDFTNFKFNSNEVVKKVKYDLSNVEGIADLVSKLGDIDILINNAGIMNSIPYNQYDNKSMEKLMNINLYSPIELINHISKSMIEKNFGRIVNTASVAGQIGHPDIWYGVSKAGIINATKSFAKILGPQGIV